MTKFKRIQKIGHNHHTHQPHSPHSPHSPPLNFSQTPPTAPIAPITSPPPILHHQRSRSYTHCSLPRTPFLSNNNHHPSSLDSIHSQHQFPDTFTHSPVYRGQYCSFVMVSTHEYFTMGYNHQPLSANNICYHFLSPPWEEGSVVAHRHWPTLRYIPWYDYRRCTIPLWTMAKLYQPPLIFSHFSHTPGIP